MEHKMAPWRVVPLRERDVSLASRQEQVLTWMQQNIALRKTRIISPQNASLLLPSLKYLTLYFRNENCGFTNNLKKKKKKQKKKFCTSLVFQWLRIYFPV